MVLDNKLAEPKIESLVSRAKIKMDEVSKGKEEKISYQEWKRRKMTRRQAELLKYIDRFITDNGFSPSYKEMMDGVGLKSKSGIHRLLSNLHKHDKIKYKKFTARSVELL